MPEISERRHSEALTTIFTLTVGTIVLRHAAYDTRDSQIVLICCLGFSAVAVTRWRRPNDRIACSIGIAIALVNVLLMALALMGIKLPYIPGFH